MSWCSQAKYVRAPSRLAVDGAQPQDAPAAAPSPPSLFRCSECGLEPCICTNRERQHLAAQAAVSKHKPAARRMSPADSRIPQPAGRSVKDDVRAWPKASKRESYSDRRGHKGQTPREGIGPKAWSPNDYLAKETKGSMLLVGGSIVNIRMGRL